MTKVPTDHLIGSLFLQTTLLARRCWLRVPLMLVTSWIRLRTASRDKVMVGSVGLALQWQDVRMAEVHMRLNRTGPGPLPRNANMHPVARHDNGNVS